MQEEYGLSLNFWRKVVFIFIFFAFTPLTLFLSILSLSALSTHEEKYSKTREFVNYPKPGAMVYASVPQEVPYITTTIVSADARVSIVKNFFLEYDSPLSDFAGYVVTTADKYGIDWRLIPAISAKESGACRVIPEGSYNCWGWGIHSKGTLMFDNYNEAIETVTKGLKEKYIDNGLVTPEEIMTRYAHPDSTTWAEGIYFYMDKLK
ncbi:MAG: hypothetical protein US62_C0012G0013 [Candidatus Woesebacteria bacterium GW2011_GWA1_37_8]|uniref:Mannosyl-glycoprotein endo-beta-N-acetylglucosamidase-like domain-containing protein n=2 Tax=Candidatus Woeseibacteriota TaxID=1752722 RepID=A0A0G0NLP1_9BACT|nr:MAG: hypothetical protein US62_C0012G0013 [Candidatus Woesebacteria bacterium GW2011_GWA1_37_8]KKQ86819.1 MAG: hypothetical protein UT10_C0016G0013 [Candidatus Woesebacteria bacterium GW2011_GWB1_38_8b]